MNGPNKTDRIHSITVIDECVNLCHLLHETLPCVSAPLFPLCYCNICSFLCAGERPFKCESCNYLAANQHEVTRHARQVHNGPKPLSCPYCEYKTADRSNYKKHVELHLNPRQFLCPLCKYAASKKCNLQYHIKSRHAGCNVAVDISKVKLRVKKSGSHGAEQNSRKTKPDSLSNVQVDFDMDEDDGDGDEDEGTNSSPINLSIRKSSRSSVNQSTQSQVPEKVQEKERHPKVKEQEKKVTTRQKKNDKARENFPEKELQSESANEKATSKAERRVKKVPTEKTTMLDQLGENETLNSDNNRVRPEKDKENQKLDDSKKDCKSLNKPRKSGTKRLEKIPEHVVHTREKAASSEQTQMKKVVKEKAPKRKAAEALDLTNKPSSETLSKTRRMKVPEKQSPASEKTADTRNVCNGITNGKHKKSKKTMKATDLQQTVNAVKDNMVSVKSLCTDASRGPAQRDNPTESTNTELYFTKNSPAKKKASTDAEERNGNECKLPKTKRPRVPANPAIPQEISKNPEKPADRSPNPTSPAVPPETVDKAPKNMKLGGSSKDTPAPLFVKPTSPPALVLPSHRTKPAETEDDEGIHSSHEGGSDISDSASEGSDDSGLNGNGTGSNKLANDPETPTEEIPTPTELKSHMCIFCDRTFPLEVVYRRHLNRHLVNVYYMDDTTPKGQK